MSRYWWEDIRDYYDEHDCELIEKAETMDWGEIDAEFYRLAHSTEAMQEIRDIQARKYHNEEFFAGMN